MRLFALLLVLLPLQALAGPVCGNGKAERREKCDGADLRGETCQTLGWDTGTLSCTSTCTLNTSQCADFPPPVCGDGAINQATESCDGADLGGMTCSSFGFDTGTLACTSSCGFDTSACEDLPTCGDGMVNQVTEECDGTDFTGLACTDFGFDAGTMACDGTCGFVLSGCYDLPVCGDGTVNQPSEECDGTDLGGRTCLTEGYDGGTLACGAGCLVDTTACTIAPPLPDGCGNYVVDGFEECDGPADAACPGACSDHCACPATAASGDLEIHVVDVGQGDGIVLVSPDGFVMVLDAGTNAQAATIAAYLGAIGITDIDYTLVSHMHADHLGGMDGVMALHPETVASFDNGRTATTGEFLEYEAAVGTRRTGLLPGDFIDLGPSITAEVLHSDVGSSNENVNSVVLRITYGTGTFLLGGDCESGCESSFDPGIIDVYKVHHHGSATSSSESLLSLMQPDVALISVGANNSYGHPTAATLDRLAAHGATVYRTDLDGDVEVLAGPDWYVVNGVSQCQNGQTRSCGTTDLGACALGTETCSSGTWQACVGAVDPIAEVCGNGTDDDCDGVLDASEPECAGPSGPPVLLVQAYYDTLGTDAVEEFVDLYNRSGSAVDLTGWTLSDNGGTWALPAGTTIPAGGYLSVARDAAGFYAHFGLSPDLSGLTLSLANSADGVTLRDALGAEADRVAWEGYEVGWTISATTGNSIVRTNPAVDTDSPSDWSTRVPAYPLGGF